MVPSSYAMLTSFFFGNAAGSNSQPRTNGMPVPRVPVRPKPERAGHAESCSSRSSSAGLPMYTEEVEWPGAESTAVDNTAEAFPLDYMLYNSPQNGTDRPDFEQMMKALQSIQMRSEQQGKQLDDIKRKLNIDPSPFRDDDEMLKKPLQDIEEFEKFDAELGTNDSTRARLLREMSGLGGLSVAHATRRILEALMNQQVAVRYSWLGQKGKKKFGLLNVAKLIIKAVKQNFADATHTEVENVIKTWLRHSGERLKKLEAKAATAQYKGPTHEEEFSD
ncbi:uncharacterized protein LOC144158449 isoform X2 [Haemaphysalis longicornis]